MQNDKLMQNLDSHLQRQWLSAQCLQLMDTRDVTPDNHQRLLQLSQALHHQFAAQLQDVVLAYHSITLHFCQPVDFSLRSAINSYLKETHSETSSTLTSATLHKIPVYYGEEVALDANLLQQRTGLSWQDIVELHTNEPGTQQPRNYRAYASGFTPGFAYLGKLDAALVSERLAKPRAKIPAGSVAIAADQTAVYPSASPGGWLIIGRTPKPLIHRPVDIVIRPGDTVQFYEIDQQTFLTMGGTLGND